MKNIINLCTPKNNSLKKENGAQDVKKIKSYKNYFKDFLNGLSDEERKKIKRSLLILKTADKVAPHYIKPIRDGIYEFRVTLKSNEFRILFIYDGKSIIVLLNSFRKKTQKIPKKELDKALKLKKEYYESKQ